MDVRCPSPGNKAYRKIKQQTSTACVVLAKQLNQLAPQLLFKCYAFSKSRGRQSLIQASSEGNLVAREGKFASSTEIGI